MIGKVAVLVILILLVFVVPVGWFLGSPEGDRNFDPTGSVFANFGAPWLFLPVLLAGAGCAAWTSQKIISCRTRPGKAGMVVGGIIVLPVGLFLGMWLGPTGWGIGEALVGPWARAPGLALGMFGVPFVAGFIGAMLGLCVVMLVRKVVGLFQR